MIATARLRLTLRLHGLHARWEQRDGDGWTTIARDRPTQAYDFGWFDGRAYHYLARQPGERFYGLGERAGGMERAGRRFRLTSLDPMGYDAATSDPLYKSIPTCSSPTHRAAATARSTTRSRAARSISGWSTTTTTRPIATSSPITATSTCG